MVRQDVDAEADPDPFGDLAQRAEDDLGARRAGEAGQEVVLDEPEGVKADLVGQRALFERLLVQAVPVDAGAFEGALHLVEKAKLHRRTSLGSARPAPGMIVCDWRLLTNDCTRGILRLSRRKLSRKGWFASDMDREQLLALALETPRWRAARKSPAV